MKNGDPILIEDDGRWLRGTFLARREDSEGKANNQHEILYKVGIGEPHFNEEREVYPHSVRRFIPLSEEAAKAKHNAELPLAFEMVRVALEGLMPGEQVEIKDGSIVGYYGKVTLDPVVYKTPRIDAVQEIAGWQVHVIHYNYATRNQPEEYEPVEVGVASNWPHAVHQFVVTIFKQKANNLFQLIGRPRTGRLASDSKRLADDAGDGMG